MAATLIVGLGGMGQKIVRKIAKMIEQNNISNVALVVMDTDVNDLRETKRDFKNIYTVQTSPRVTVGNALDNNDFARERWFPVNDGLTGKPFTEGAGQVRAVSRLAFDSAIEKGLMADLEAAIESLHAVDGDAMQQELRVMLCGSNNGGTGSGLVLPVAMYIRNLLNTRYQDNSAIIRGYFLQPDTIFDRITDEGERLNLSANAYATIREVDAFFRKDYAGEVDKLKHVVFNAPQPGTVDRVDYPNILPYHFVFLHDGLNCERERLPNHEAYLDQAAQNIYAQALSAVSARSNSSEDNVIRSLAASNGRSRYCGAGSSFVRFPHRDVKRYVGLRWAADNISNEWLEIDNEYETKKRDDHELSRRDFYVDTFKGRIEAEVKFYKKIAKHTQTSYEVDGRQNFTYPAEEYQKAVKSHALDVRDSRLTSSCLEYSRTYNGGEGGSNYRIKDSEEGIQELIKDEQNASSAQATIEIQYQTFYEYAVRYYRSIQSEVAGASKKLADADFSVGESQKDPILERTKAWQVESLIRVEQDGSRGAMHPGAARYMLYWASQSLENEIEDVSSKLESAKSLADGLINTLGSQEDQEASSGSEKKHRISMPWAKEKIDETTMESMVEYAKKLRNFKSAIDEYRDFTVQKAYLETAKAYVDRMSLAYENYYDQLKSNISSLSSQADAIRGKKEYQLDAKGSTIRYVCASMECLDKILHDCPIEGDSASLPLDMCGNIYNKLLRYSQMDKNSSNAERSATLKDIYSETVEDYWVNRVSDPSASTKASAIVDMDIVDAIIKEGDYLDTSESRDEKDLAKYRSAHIKKVLEQGYKLAAPFIEPPSGFDKLSRHFKTFAYSGVLKDTNYWSYFEEEMAQYNPVPIPKSEKYSTRQIMFYRSMYGFQADTLPKFAPEFIGEEHRPAGQYNKAYWSLVNQLSPNLKENNLITPHIDKYWHLVERLPDLSDDYERDVHAKNVYAFIFGLVYQKFGADHLATGDNVFYLKSAKNRKRADLWVSNGTICDKFYEIYDALKYNPPIVNTLDQISQRELEQEHSNSNSTSVRNCNFLSLVRSYAFLDDEFAEKELDDLLTKIRNSPDNVDEDRESFYDDALLTSDFFFQGRKSDPDGPRRSILEIPLYYRISLPQIDTRSGEIETMVETIFDIVRAHLLNFSTEQDIDEHAGRFFEEQYMLFERNLVDIALDYPEMAYNPVIGVIREKTLSFMEPVTRRYERIKNAQNSIEVEWSRLLKKDETQKKRSAKSK